MAASITTIASAIAALKEYYGDNDVLNSTILKRNVLFGMLPKNPDFVGEWIKVPLTSSASAGIGASFSTVQGNSSPSVLRAFQVPVLSVYGNAQVSNMSMMASRNDEGAFKSLLKVETDNSMEAVTNLLSNYFFRSGTGTLGAIGNLSSGTITFTNLTDAQFFYPGLAITASSGDGSGTVRAGIGYVQSVDRSGGTMVVATTQGQNQSGASPSGWANGDSLQVQSTYNTVPVGVAGWIPYTAATRPTVANALPPFNGVDRSVDPVAYAGTWYNGASESQMDALIDGLSETFRNGGSPEVVVTNPISLRALLKELMGKREYISVEGPTGVSYKAVEIETDNGPIPVISDRNCPPQVAFALDMSTWSVESYDQAPQFLRYGGAGGTEGFFLPSADGIEVRIGAYCNLICRKPQANGAISLGQ